MDWDYLTEPQKELDGREIYWPRGKMLGGSSSMNAMMWVRGFAADYDEWGAAAGEQWSYARLEPYLRPHRERATVSRATAQPAYVHRRVAQGRTGMRLSSRGAQSS